MKKFEKKNQKSSTLISSEQRDNIGECWPTYTGQILCP